MLLDFVTALGLMTLASAFLFTVAALSRLSDYVQDLFTPEKEEEDEGY